MSSFIILEKIISAELSIIGPKLNCRQVRGKPHSETMSLGRHRGKVTRDLWADSEGGGDM